MVNNSKATKLSTTSYLKPLNKKQKTKTKTK